MKFDFKRIRREFAKLHIPKEYYNPCSLPLERNKYFVILSTRSKGKTTNVLLLGMVCHKLYGTQVQYIRQNDRMLQPKTAKQMLDVILANGYIEKITNNEYNSAFYWGRGWYFCLIDEKGEIAKKDTKPFISCLSIDKWNEYKSVYNAPTGDIIIFDEFVGKIYAPDEFLYFCDLTKTIIRERENPIIFMLANTIDAYNDYFREMEIADYIPTIEKGDKVEVKTSLGTPICIEYYDNATPLRDKINSLFYGFQNSRLGAITGAASGWLIMPCQHIDKDDNPDILDNSHYIEVDSNYLRLQVCDSELHGLHIRVLPVQKFKLHEDTIVYTLSDSLDFHYRYAFGHSKLDKIIFTLFSRNLFFYRDNTTYALLSKYINRAKQQRLSSI